MRTGIRRKVDDLGRVVIPAGVRRSLGIREGDALEVAVEGDQVILSKPADSCVFCGSPDTPHSFRGKPLCPTCIVAVTAIGERAGEVVVGGDTTGIDGRAGRAAPPADRDPDERSSPAPDPGPTRPVNVPPAQSPASTTAW